MAARRVIVLVLLAAAPAAADVWLEPNPWRRDALLEGRDFNYTSEAFLHRESYRHRSREPTSDRDGLRGTAGSVTGDELHTDIHVQKTLWADAAPVGVFVRMQRFEDFDGYFDRQVVGVATRLGSAWQVALAGDVTGDKADSAVQLEARWQPGDDRLLRLVYVAPDLLFNDKAGDGRYRQQPQTAFAHYRQRFGAGWAELAVNVSPRASFETGDGLLLAEGRQTRVLAQGEIDLDGRRVGGRLEIEQTRRRFDRAGAAPAGAEAFRRDFSSAGAYLALDDVPLSPVVGVRYLNLDEDGWFGTGFGSTGRVRRDEWIGYAGIRVQATARQRWEPTVYVDRFDVARRFFDVAGRNSVRDGWAAKLAVPWRYTLDEAAGAVLTLNLTVRLHTAAFGGGNVQLHWPL